MTLARDLLLSQMGRIPLQQFSRGLLVAYSHFFHLCFTAGVTVLELSSEHKLMVAGSQDGSMLVWNMENIEVMQALTGHTGEPFKRQELFLDFCFITLQAELCNSNTQTSVLAFFPKI